MDMWSSTTSAPYMSYTVHFIDPRWSLQSWCLQTLFVPQDHDANNLADVMTETLANWSLKGTMRRYGSRAISMISLAVKS